jgi:hypothetical protein
MFGIESNARQILPNAQTHEVIASELLAGQAIPCGFLHLPGPGQIFVGDALLAEMTVGLAPGQDNPDQFRKRDPRFADQERFQDGIHGRTRPDAKPSLFTTADFSFDPSKQVYLCPQGKELTCHARHQTNRYRTYDIYQARPEDCATCPVRARCLSKPTTLRWYRSIPVDTQPPNLIDEMKAKIDSEVGKRIYARRLGVVEPVFANLCVHKRMHHFTLRSKSKVDVQWPRTRFALVHNIGKIQAFGMLP